MTGTGYEENLSAQQSKAPQNPRIPGEDEDPWGSGGHPEKKTERPKAPGRLKSSREGFPRNFRIRKTSEYRRIYAAGRKIHRGPFVVFYLGNDTPHHRLGVTATKRIGNAVLRNRVKRRIREVFRREKSVLGSRGVDLVVNARRRVETIPWKELKEEFRNCGVMIQKEMEQG